MFSRVGRLSEPRICRDTNSLSQKGPRLGSLGISAVFSFDQLGCQISCGKMTTPIPTVIKNVKDGQSRTGDRETPVHRKNAIPAFPDLSDLTPYEQSKRVDSHTIRSD